jgi:hypothetical protein
MMFCCATHAQLRMSCSRSAAPQFTKLNTFFREEARQREGGGKHAENHGGGH